MCCSVRSCRSKHGGHLPRLQGTQNGARQPVLWVPPTARESAIDHTPLGRRKPRQNSGHRYRGRSAERLVGCAHGHGRPRTTVHAGRFDCPS